jgi:protein TonB
MDDRVGELLAERARLGGGTAAGVAVSLLLHGSLTAAAVYAATHASAPQAVSAMNIQITAMPSRAPAAVAAPATPVPAPPAPKPEKLKIPEPVPEVPAPPAVKTTPKTVPFSPFGKSNRKGSETPAAAPAPHAPPAAAAKPGVSADIPVGGSGVTALEGGDFPYTIYIDRMKALIGQHWLRPQGATGVTATVSFAVDRDGTIHDVKNETLSGNGAFDRAALRAILEASPLPPLPFAYNGTYLGVHLTFR